MGRGGILRVSIPLLKKHMEEWGKALTIGESAELLGVSYSAALGVLDFMEVTGIVQRVRRGRYFYFLKDTYGEERIETMILEDYERTKNVNGRSRARSKYDPIIDRFLELEDDLVRVEVEEKKASYVAGMLKKRIQVRELEIKATAISDVVYLEKDLRE